MYNRQGPWFKDGNFIREIDSGSLIAEVYISPNRNAPNNKMLTYNIKLLSFAPELLDVLKLAKTLIDQSSIDFNSQDLKRIDDILKELEK